jgi:acyl-CoA thioester hydrolase
MSQDSAAPPPFRYYLRVRYHECDAQRVVFNGNYGTYVDMALTEFLTVLLPDRHTNATARPSETPLEFQLVRQLIEWTGPARFNDIIEISAWCERLGTTSFVMRFALRKPGEAEPFVTAETVNVVMDGKTWTKLVIDPGLRDKLLTGAPGVQIDHAGYLATVAS